MTGAGPGTRPTPNPIPVPLRMALMDFRQILEAGDKAPSTAEPAPCPRAVPRASPRWTVPLRCRRGRWPRPRTRSRSRATSEPKVKRASPVDRIEADRADDQADHRHHQRFEERAPGHIAKNDEAEDHEREVLGRTEGQRRPGQGGSQNAPGRKARCVPAMKEPMAQIASAGPALPFWAIW